MRRRKWEVSMMMLIPVVTRGMSINSEEVRVEITDSFQKKAEEILVACNIDPTAQKIACIDNYLRDCCPPESEKRKLLDRATQERWSEIVTTLNSGTKKSKFQLIAKAFEWAEEKGYGRTRHCRALQGSLILLLLLGNIGSLLIRFAPFIN